MRENIIIAGSGGQGIMLLGKIIAESAMRENKHVTWLPAYGAEVRGGTAHCTVIISDKEIGSPYIRKADTLIIMNQPSLEKFHGRLVLNGLFILNSSLIETARSKNKSFFKYPFTQIAIELGNIKVANMIALGFYIAKKKLINMATVLKVIQDFAPEDKKGLIEINRQALLRGERVK